MQIADLFINIGLKGGGQAEKGLDGIGKQLSNVASTSLATKAGILGVVYAAEELARGAANYGLSLHQYEGVTGHNIEVLERWQKAMRNTGVTAEDMQGSFRNFFGIVGQISAGGAAPAGFGLLQREGLDINRAAKDDDYRMKFLKDFWTRDIPDLNKAAKAGMLKNAGLSDAILSGFSDKRMLDPDKLKPDFTQKQVTALAGLSSDMENIRSRMMRLGGGIAAEWGSAAIKDVNTFIGGIEHLVSALDKLAGKVGVAKDLKLEFAAVAAVGLTFGPLNAALAGILFFLAEMEKHKSDKEGFWGQVNSAGTKGWFDKTTGNMPEWLKTMTGWKGTNYEEIMRKQFDPKIMGPKLPAVQPSGMPVTVNLDVTHNGDAKDTHAVVDSHKKGIETAFNLLSAKYQVT